MIRGGLSSNLNLGIASFGTSGNSESRSTTDITTSSRYELPSPRIAAINALEKARRPLIIDDFHYLEREYQGNVLRGLKPLILDGLPVIAIAIPHRRYDAVRVEREMIGRLETIGVPEWTTEELLEIPRKGFALLNVDVSTEDMSRMAQEAHGSPHLMQEFCKQLCHRFGIDTTPADRRTLDLQDDLFREVADQTGKVIYDKLRRGPRRTDRMQRGLRDGTNADIYAVVLLALGKLRPGMTKVEYDSIRDAIQMLITTKDEVPQRHEVSRVLDKMSDIAMSDESSVPVLDWDKEEGVLHITDPFFAFYLKWGDPRGNY